MKRRIHLQKKIRIPQFHLSKHAILLLTLGMLLIGLYMALCFIGKRVEEPLTLYAENEATKLTRTIINKTISEIVAEDNQLDQLFDIERGSNDDIQTIDFNPVIVNQFLSKIIQTIQINLKGIESGNYKDFNLEYLGDSGYDLEKLQKGIIYEMPIGLAFHNPILANIGPRIPVRVSLVGSISGNIQTKVTNYGINNAYVESTIYLEVEQLIVLPIIQKSIKIEISTPLSMKLIQGTVPNYYFNGLDKNSGILSIPIE